MQVLQKSVGTGWMVARQGLVFHGTVEGSGYGATGNTLPLFITKQSASRPVEGVSSGVQGQGFGLPGAGIKPQ